MYSAHLSNGKVHMHNVCESSPTYSLFSCTNITKNLSRFVTNIPKKALFSVVFLIDNCT